MPLSAHCDRVRGQYWSSSGLLPMGTWSLYETMLVYHKWDFVAFTLGQFHRNCAKYQSVKRVRILQFLNYCRISQVV